MKLKRDEPLSNVAFNFNLRSYKVDFTAGDLTALYLNVTAGIAIGDTGDGSPVFDLTIFVEVTLVPANSEPLVCAAEGSIDLGPLQVKFFEAMLTLYPTPVAPGKPKVSMSATLEDITIGSVNMGTVSLAGDASSKNVTTDGVSKIKWYVIGTLTAEVGFDIGQAAALGILPSSPTPHDRDAAALGGAVTAGGTVTFNSDTKAGRCRLTISLRELKARLMSAISA